MRRAARVIMPGCLTNRMAMSEEIHVSDGERDRVVELLKEHTAQ